MVVSMGLDLVRRAPLYQTYIRPIVWAPIQAYREYRNIKKERFYQELAKQDVQHLAQARHDMDEYYAQEQEPLVSITTATYNRAKFLVESTLPAVLAQSYKNIEWLIVGDYCTDNTAELLATIDDPRVRFFNLPKRPRYPRNKQKRWKVVGVQAINMAHDMAGGSWVAHLDDDDVFTPDHIQKLLAHAQEGNYEFVYGRCKIENRSGEWIERKSAPTGNGSEIGHISHSTVLYRSYLGRCFKYDARCLKVNAGGDGFRWRRMVNVGVRVGFLNEVVTSQPLRPGEASRSIFQPA